MAGTCCCSPLSPLGSGDQAQVGMLGPVSAVSEHLSIPAFSGKEASLRICGFLTPPYLLLLPDLQVVNAVLMDAPSFRSQPWLLFLSTLCDSQCTTSMQLAFFETGSHYVVKLFHPTCTSLSM